MLLTSAKFAKQRDTMVMTKIIYNPSVVYLNSHTRVVTLTI